MGALNAGMVPLRREAVVVAVLLVVGIACGLYFGKVLSGEPHSAPADYAVLVARLYANDQDKSAALSRLREGGFESPTEAISEIAASYPTTTPEQASDAQSLRELAQALGAATAPPAGGGIPTTYILAGLVALVALGMVALLATRILGLNVPPIRASDALGRASQAFRRPRAFTPPSGASPAVTWSSPSSPQGAAAQPSAQAGIQGQTGAEYRNGHAAGRPVPPVAASASSSIRTRPMQTGEASGANARGRPAGGGIQPIPLRPGQHRSEEAQRTYSFRSSYRLGDEPYDEIHPISDETGKALVGACGVSASRFVTERGQKRYWGFTAWLHDYASDGEFRAVGLVSRWAHDHFADEIDDWRGDIDEVKLVEFDEQIEIETAHLAATLLVEDVDYVQGGPPEATFNRLAAQFDVDVLDTTGTESSEAQSG